VHHSTAVIDHGGGAELDSGATTFYADMVRTDALATRLGAVVLVVSAPLAHTCRLRLCVSAVG
jgi:hypothetical protein